MKKGEKRKQELLQIAYDLFLAQGYEKTSVDEIIEKAQIAKGTFYYYFSSKEQMLEEVIDRMIEEETEAARQILRAPIPVPRKIAGIIGSVKPAEAELPIQEAVMQPENALMHDRIRNKLIQVLVPLLSEAVEEGVREGVFVCDNIPERVKMLLVISNETFNNGPFSERDLSVFVDVTEKLLGAGRGAMGFLCELIDKANMEKSGRPQDLPVAQR